MTAKNRANGASTATPEAGTTRTTTLHHITLKASPSASVFEVDTAPDDLLTQKAAQLRSLLMMTYGASREGFTELHDADQDNILWLAHSLASEINLLAEVMAGGGVE